MTETFGHYTVLDRLGTGGLGELYRARDTKSGRTVALRVLSDTLAWDADGRARLLASLHAATALSHPGIATLYEVGEDRGRRFFALEFVPGESLARLAAGHGMNPRRAIGYAIQIADALAEAHALGVEHGHLSAASVMVTPKGQAKILDFGSAEWTRAGAQERRPDLEAFGSLLRELVHGGQRAGTPPGASVSDPFADVSAIAAGLVSGGQFESAATAAAALRELAERLDAVVPPVVPPPQPRAGHASPRRPLMWLVVLAGLIGVAALIYATTQL